MAGIPRSATAIASPPGLHRDRRDRSGHAVTLDLHHGEPLRFGPDERDAGDVPRSVSFDTEIPGGYSKGDIVLPRPDTIRAEDGKLLAFGRTYEAETNRTFHEGRITGINIGASDITLELEGFVRHLADNQTAREIFYDRDFSRWAGPSLRRQLALYGVGRVPQDASVAWDTALGASALQASLQSPWDGGDAIPRVEGWYDSESLDLAALDYAWAKSDSVDDTDTNYVWSAGGSDDDTGTNREATANLSAAGPGSGTLSFDTVKRFLDVAFTFGAANGANGKRYDINWTLLAAIGAHGLPLQGDVATPADGRGLLVSDMVAYIVATWAPLLRFTTGVNGSIETTGYPVPQCAFTDDTTAQAMIEALLVFGGAAQLPLDYGVYDNREFFCKSPGSYGRVWEARRDQAAASDDEGPDGTALVNGVKVTYDDGSGKVRSIGPPGSRSDTETVDLVDASPLNPANRDGAAHWITYDAGILNDAGAVLIGQLKLYDARTQPWRGSVSIPSSVRTIDGQRFPAAMVRGGDQVVVTDDPDTRPRRVVNTTYDGMGVVASCGQRPDHLDVLLAQAGVVLQGRL